MKSKTDIRTLSEKELNARLVRDLTEVCPAGEREALAAWRAADPAHEEEYARIRSYWNARVTTTRSIDQEREFRKLQRRIAAGSESRRSGMLRLLATRMGRYASMAAMLAVGLFCGWALSGPRAAERFAFITGSSISSFELPDGSRITLDKESRLEYDGDFGRDERNVRLVGKGFFEVEKMPDKRFVVEMGDVQEVFRRPQSAIAKQLILPQGGAVERMAGSRTVRIVFDGMSSFEPVISNMTLECRTPVNILFADTKNIDGKAFGHMILQLPEDAAAIERIRAYLESRGITYKEEEPNVHTANA